MQFHLVLCLPYLKFFNLRDIDEEHACFPKCTMLLLWNIRWKQIFQLLDKITGFRKPQSRVAFVNGVLGPLSCLCEWGVRASQVPSTWPLELSALLWSNVQLGGLRKYPGDRGWKWKCWSLSCVQLFAAPWTVAHQAPLSMVFSRQYWSELPFPSQGDLPNPGINPRSPELQAKSLLSGPSGKP